MGCSWVTRGLSEGRPRIARGSLMDFPWGTNEFSWGAHGSSFGCPPSVAHGLSVGCSEIVIRGFHWFPMGRLWIVRGAPMGRS